MGDLVELVVFERTLSAAERDAMETYLAGRLDGDDGGDGHTVRWNTANRGDGDAQGGFTEHITVRNLTTGVEVVNTTLDSPDALAVGATRENEFSFNAITPGRYRVQVTTDSGEAFFEFNAAGHDPAETNNTTTAEFVIVGPDLVVTSRTAPTGLIVGNPAQVPVSWTVENQGPATGFAGTWVDRVFFSTDAIVGNGDDVQVGEFVHSGLLDPDEAYTQEQTVALPAGLTGQFFIYVRTDAANVSPEPDAEHNNASALASIDVTVPFADLIVEAVSAPDSSLSGDPIAVAWRARNQGVSTTNVSSWIDRILLSADGVLDAGDVELKRVTRSGALAKDASYTGQTTVDLPDGIGGDFHVFVVTDFLNAVFEHVHDGNNTGRTVTPIAVTRKLDPNLAVTALDAPGAGQPKQTVTIHWTVENTGPGIAADDWMDRVYLSNDGTLNGAVLLATVSRTSDLESGGTYSVSRDVELPTVADDTYRFVVATDQADTVFEGDGENDNLRVSGPVTIGHPDLTPQIDTAPTTAVSGTVVAFAWAVSNSGTAAAMGSWVDRIYLSSDGAFNTGDRLLAERTHAGPLAATSGYSDEIDLQLPPELTGNRFLLLVTDAADAVFEPGDEDNNVANAAIAIELAPYADLLASDVVAAELTVGDPAEVTVTWTVTNDGTGTGTVAQWIDRIIASTDTTVGNGDDRFVAEFTRDGLLAVDESYTRTETFLLPPALQGRFHLFVKTDAAGAVFENNLEANNIAESPTVFDVTRIPYADLVVGAVDVAPEGASGQPLEISWTVTNQGIGLTSTTRWSDTVRLATDRQGQNIVANLGSFDHSGPLAPDGSYTRTAEALIPNGLTGTFYVVVDTGGPFEFIFTDNNRGISTETTLITLTPPPDLVVTNITAPPEALSGTKIDVTWTVRNAGTGDAAGSWTDRAALKPVGGGSTIPLGTFTFSGPTELGKSYTRSEQLMVPAQVQGQFQVVVTTNSSGSLYEHGQTGNNTTEDDQTIVISLPERPDLQVQSIIAPDTASAGATASLEFIVINQGTVATQGRWQDKVYLSLDNVIGGDDVLLATLDNAAALEPEGGTYSSEVTSFEIPRRFRGDVFLIVQADAGNAINEHPQEGNNILVRPIEIIPLPPSDLVTSNVLAPDQAFEGSTIEVRYRVTNLGVGETDRDGWTDTIWLTQNKDRPHPVDSDGDPQDYLLASFSHTGSLEVDEFYGRTVTVRLPAQITGEWFITPWTDAFDVITEDTFDVNINPDDPNELDSNNYKSRPITVLLTPPPDLVVTAVVPDSTGAGGEPFSISWTVTNEGSAGTQTDRWTDKIYLSDAPVLNAPGAKQLQLGIIERVGHLPAGDSYTSSASFDLTPAAVGQYVIVVTGGGAWEGPFKDNNARSAPTDVTNAPADFVVTSVVTPSENFSGEKTTISWTVRNDGSAVWPGTRFWTDQVWISADPTFIPGRATSLGSFAFSPTVPFTTVQSYTQTREVTLPRGIGGKVDPGDFYIYVTTNTGGRTDFFDGRNEFSRTYFETNAFEVASNNQGSAPISVTYREPDLQVTDIVLPPTPPHSGETIPVTFTVTNIGTRDTREVYWKDALFLSRDPSLDEDDQYLGFGDRFPNHVVLEQGSSYEQTLHVALPDGIEGDFYILVFSDSNLIGPLPPGGPGNHLEDFLDRPPGSIFARVMEFQDEGNNITAAPLEVVLSTPPDLEVTEVVVPERVTAGQNFDVQYTVTNTGSGPTPAKHNRWDDLIYLSRDEFLDLSSDRFLGHQLHSGVLAAGAGYDVTRTFKAPTDLDGPFYVFVVTDPIRSGQPRGKVFEGADEANNATPSSPPMLIEQPPPSDLQATLITIPGSAQSGETVEIEWTVTNAMTRPRRRARGPTPCTCRPTRCGTSATG